MNPEPQEIEVEVVETIDSVPARIASDTQEAKSPWLHDHPWQSQLRRINLRWWPLWSILALLLLIPLLVLGILVTACWLVLRIIGRLLGGR